MDSINYASIRGESEKLMFLHQRAPLRFGKSSKRASTSPYEPRDKLRIEQRGQNGGGNQSVSSNGGIPPRNRRGSNRRRTPPRIRGHSIGGGELKGKTEGENRGARL